MKAEYMELKNSYGEIRLFPETLDDLWHIKHLVSPGDLVFADTFRSMEQAGERLRPEKAEKKRVRLGIRVEGVEFHQHANRLRISGIIEHGADLSSYHTLNIVPATELSVIKQWSRIDRDRITRAVQAADYSAVHILCIEEGEAQVFRLRQSGPEWVASVTMGSGKGADLDMRGAFYSSVLGHLKGITAAVIIAGPGFIKDEFLRYLRERDRDLAERAIMVETQGAGLTAVREVIGKGVPERLVGDLHLAREVQLMDEVLQRIAKEGAVAYGREEVADAVGCGAVERVLVSDRYLRDEEITGIIESAEQMNAGVTVLSSEFEPGKHLDALGGVAALLRYRLK